VVTFGIGRAHTAVIDALDAEAVEEYIDGIARQAHSIDIVFNATGPLAKEYGNGKSAVDLTVEEFMVPQNTVVKSQFITARAAARQMLKQHAGVLIFLTGGPARAHVRGTTAIGAAFGAIESLTRNMALELGPAGIRVACLRSAGMPDTRTIQHTMDDMIRVDQDPAAVTGRSGPHRAVQPPDERDGPDRGPAHHYRPGPSHRPGGHG
jgi:3-oxoacyl-[acyl-carrier protein] reductase